MSVFERFQRCARAVSTNGQPMRRNRRVKNAIPKPVMAIVVRTESFINVGPG